MGQVLRSGFGVHVLLHFLGPVFGVQLGGSFLGLFLGVPFWGNFWVHVLGPFVCLILGPQFVIFLIFGVLFLGSKFGLIFGAKFWALLIFSRD